MVFCYGVRRLQGPLAQWFSTCGSVTARSPDDFEGTNVKIYSSSKSKSTRYAECISESYLIMLLIKTTIVDH